MSSPRAARPPHARDRAGLALLAVGALAIAYAAIGWAGLPTPAEELDADTDPAAVDDALERFRSRLDRYARVQAVGIGSLALGAFLMVQRPWAGPVPVWRRFSDWGGPIAALGILIARWQSIGVAQFGAAWDHWLTVEAVAWLVWIAAVVGVRIQERGLDMAPDPPRG